MRDWKRKPFSRPNELSLPVSQLVYVQDATLYKSVVQSSAVYSNKSSSSPLQWGSSSHSTFSPGPALQNSTYAAAFCEQGQGRDATGWECAASSSAGFSQLPPQSQSFNVAGPPQLVAKEGGNFWGDIGFQGPEIIAGPGHSWFGGGSSLALNPLDAPPMSYMPLGHDATYPFSKNAHFNNNM